MQSEQFRDLVAGWPESHLAGLLQVSLRTIQRWKAGKAPPPHSAILALSWYCRGDFGALWPVWKGFYIDGGKLHTPGYFRRPLSPEMLLAMFFELQELHNLRVEVKKLRLELASLKVVRLASSTDRSPADLALWSARKVQALKELGRR